MEQKYGPDPDLHPEFDPEAWCGAIGGMKTTRTHVYGFGTTPRAKQIFTPCSTPETASSSVSGVPSRSGAPSRSVGAATEVDELRQEVSTVKETLVGLQDQMKEAIQLLMRHCSNPPIHGRTTNIVARTSGGSSTAPNNDMHHEDDELDSD